MQKFIEILAKRVSARLGRKVETYEIEYALEIIVILIIAMLGIIFLGWFSFGLHEKTAEISTAFVKHFTTIK